MKPKDEGSGSKHSSSNRRPVSRQLLRSSSKSWFKYFTAWSLEPIPWDFSRLCWSFAAMPDILKDSKTCRLPATALFVCAVRQVPCCACYLALAHTLFHSLLLFHSCCGSPIVYSPVCIRLWLLTDVCPTSPHIINSENKHRPVSLTALFLWSVNFSGCLWSNRLVRWMDETAVTFRIWLCAVYNIKVE